MDFIYYLSKYTDKIKEINPNFPERTIEDYLAVFAALPPSFEEPETPKYVLEAEEYREEGNMFFALGKYEEAALLYTVSIRKSPAYTKCGALAYANRSAALYRLKSYEECISDIDRALDLPYPKDLRQKIISRKESALNILKNQSVNNNTNNENTPTEDQKYAHGENSALPGTSLGIDIVYNQREGRKLIAKMPFQTGDVLVMEKPYLMAHELNEAPSYCVNCLKKTFCLIPCDRCDEAVYCSEKCLNYAYDNYHRIECRITTTLTSAIPLNTQALFCRLRCLNILTQQGNNLKELCDDIKEIEESKDPARVGFTGDRFIGNTRKGFLSLLANMEIKDDYDPLFEACYIVTLLRNYTNFFKSNSDVPVVAEIMLKLIEIYDFNHFIIPYSGGTSPRAHAIFPLIGVASHACVNNTITYIDDQGRMILRASQYIRPGDQIHYNYNDLVFSFDEVAQRSGRAVRCKRVCKRCEKSYVYPPERHPNIKMDKKLRSRMQKNPYDIEGLWKILNIVKGKHQHYNLHAQMIKSMLVEAYEGRIDISAGYALLHMFGII